jgi:cephalosporin hydroxylase
VEIGIRAGGSSELIMRVLSLAHPDYTHIGIDCYGDMPQVHSETEVRVMDYSNAMRNGAIASLFGISSETQIDFAFFNLEDSEFFRRFADGVPLYSGSQKRIGSRYGLVHLDGPHSAELVEAELRFFAPRCVRSAHIVVDDVHMFDIESAERVLLLDGWSRQKSTSTRSCYVKD